MPEWRVTKYDPAHRDASGRYTRDEWTSSADIGRSHAGGTLTRAQYLDVEGRYVEAVLRFLEDSGTPSLFVRGVETAQWDSCQPADDVLDVAPREGQGIVVADVACLCRACLREWLWCRLESEEGSFFVHFGWDYYMYIGSSFACRRAIAETEAAGLFVEPWTSPHHGGEDVVVAVRHQAALCSPRR